MALKGSAGVGTSNRPPDVVGQETHHAKMRASICRKNLLIFFRREGGGNMHRTGEIRRNMAVRAYLSVQSLRNLRYKKGLQQRWGLLE